MPLFPVAGVAPTSCHGPVAWRPEMSASAFCRSNTDRCDIAPHCSALSSYPHRLEVLPSWRTSSCGTSHDKTLPTSCGETAHTSRWSAAIFAVKAGLGRSYYGGIEQGERNVAALNLMRIAVALEVETGQLFPATETMGTLLDGTPAESQ